MPGAEGDGVSGVAGTGLQDGGGMAVRKGEEVDGLAELVFDFGFAAGEFVGGLVEGKRVRSRWVTPWAPTKSSPERVISRSCAR